MSVPKSEGRMSKPEKNLRTALRNKVGMLSALGLRHFFGSRQLTFGLVLSCLGLASIAPDALAQSYYNTAGSEYAIAGHLLGDEDFPQMSLNADGGYIVWQDNASDGDGFGISAA